MIWIIGIILDIQQPSFIVWFISIILLYEYLDCIQNVTCCDGFLSVCNTNLECEPELNWAGIWPSEFFAAVIDRHENNNSCCYKLSAIYDNGPDTKSVIVEPDTFYGEMLYEFDENYPVNNVQKCVCDQCDNPLIKVVI